MLEQLQVATILSDYNLLPHIWNLPLSQCKETLQKPEEVQESQYNTRGSKGSPRILSKNILLFPSMQMWKKCLWNNSTLQNTSTQKRWNYLSTRQWSVCSCHTLLWSVGNLCAAFPPPLLNLERREESHDPSVCFWFFRAQYTNLSLKKKKIKNCTLKTKLLILDKQLLPISGTKTPSTLLR